MTKQNPVGLKTAEKGRKWNEGLKVDLTAMFVDLGKAVLAGTLVTPLAAAVPAMNAIKAIGRKPLTAEQAARRWILRSLVRAVYELVGGNYGLLGRPQGDLEQICAGLDLGLTEEPVVVSKDFLKRPDRIPLVKKLEKPLAKWLQGMEMSPKPAQATAARLGRYFTGALWAEWNETLSADERTAIRGVLDNPITEAEEREWAWGEYHARLEREVAEPVFGIEPFSLEQIHVDLFGYTEDEGKDDGGRGRLGRGARGDLDGGKPDSKKVVVGRVKNVLKAWLDEGDSTDQWRVISGGPGAGKSSLVKMFAVEQVRRAGNNWRVLFVPLHRVNYKTDLAPAIADILEGHLLQRHNPLERGSDESKLLLILDGLDEVAEQGKVGASAARSFLQDVRNRLAGDAASGWKVLLTGRPAAVDAAELTECRKAGALIHLAPLWTSEHNRQDYENGDQMEKDLRAEWWNRYAGFKGQPTSGLKDLTERAPVDVTSQPLLLYLTAWGRDQGFSFAEDFNLNQLYGFLLEKIYERPWDRGQHEPTKQAFTLAEFVEALETAAVAAWHSEGRGATVGAVRRAHGGKLPHALQSLVEDEKAGLLRLMMAFYLRPRGFEDGEASFEFTHKSFREYLTARAILRRLREILRKLRIDREHSMNAYGVHEALVDWARLCGPTLIDWDVYGFVRNETKFFGKEECASVQREICIWISHVLQVGMPMELLRDEIPTYGEMDRQAWAAESALLVLASSYAAVSGEMQSIVWPSPTAAIAWLGRLVRPEQFGPVRWSFFRINLEGAFLMSPLLEQVNLAGANLTGALLVRENLLGAHLAGANLTGAVLAGATLEGADLEGANLEGANLEGTILGRADLAGAKLGDANLKGASFVEAMNFEDALDLDRAKGLDQAILSDEQRALLTERGILPSGE